jgi:hypothetical protein
MFLSEILHNLLNQPRHPMQLEEVHHRNYQKRLLHPMLYQFEFEVDCNQEMSIQWMLE